MRISVLAVVKTQPLLVASARAFVRSEPFIGIQSIDLPGGLQIDREFHALPLQVGSGVDVLQGLSTPERAETFLVRCFVEADSPADVRTEVDGIRLLSDPMIGSFPTCGSHPAIGSSADVCTALDTVGLATRNLDGSNVAVAIVDTGIALPHLTEKLGKAPRFDAAISWVPGNLATEPGHHPLDHGTMCAYDVLLAAPKATLLDYPVLLARPRVDEHSVKSTIATAIIAHAKLLVDWAINPKLQSYNALVVNNSWGIYHESLDFPKGSQDRYIDNFRHYFRAFLAALGSVGVDVLFAAGNCGRDCPAPSCRGVVTGTIWGANAYPEVLTIAGCDVTDTRVGYSSQGPSIFNQVNDKPDLTAYTHFEGSEVQGAGEPDTGTSAACPVAAGCVAALRSASSMSPRNPKAPMPTSLFGQLKRDARPAPRMPPGWNRDYGHGIIDPVTTATSFGL